MRYELPDDLTPEEERAAIAALERYFTDESRPPDAWTVSSRAANTRTLPLHVRRTSPRAWQNALRYPLAQRSYPHLHGRGDAR